MRAAWTSDPRNRMADRARCCLGLLRILHGSNATACGQLRSWFGLPHSWELSGQRTDRNIPNSWKSSLHLLPLCHKKLISFGEHPRVLGRQSIHQKTRVERSYKSVLAGDDEAKKQIWKLGIGLPQGFVKSKTSTARSIGVSPTHMGASHGFPHPEAISNVLRTCSNGRHPQKVTPLVIWCFSSGMPTPSGGWWSIFFGSPRKTIQTVALYPRMIGIDTELFRW